MIRVAISILMICSFCGCGNLSDTPANFQIRLMDSDEASSLKVKIENYLDLAFTGEVRATIAHADPKMMPPLTEEQWKQLESKIQQERAKFEPISVTVSIPTQVAYSDEDEVSIIPYRVKMERKATIREIEQWIIASRRFGSNTWHLASLSSKSTQRAREVFPGLPWKELGYIK